MKKNWKRLAALLLGLTMLVGSLPMASAEFVDAISQDSSESVRWAVQTGVCVGVSESDLALDAPTTRAQAVTMLYRMAGEPAFMNDNIFRDVPHGSWYEHAVIWAHGKGIVSGVGDGCFAPDALVTREQLTTMLFRYDNYCAVMRGEEPDKAWGNTNILSFDDAFDLSGFAVSAVQWACTRNIAMVDGWELRPQAVCTREETVQFLWSYEPYADPNNWAYCESEAEGKADVFFVTPTVFLGKDGRLTWDSYDAEMRSSFVGAINMEKGIYDTDTRFFAPMYHQASLIAYDLPQEEQEALFDTVYAEVRESFLYYLEHFNNGQPIILAGFSQGADMCIRLLKDCFADPEVNDLLVACYAVGWRITEEELAENPHIRFAERAGDTGVLIAFNTEAESVTESLMIPSGVKTRCINPLNWKTDGTPALAVENSGACFTDYSGGITKEIPNLTGAYIDQTRGALKATDVSAADYPGVLFEDGVYHLYDYQFFYRNLQENVQLRLANYLAAH